MASTSSGRWASVSPFLSPVVPVVPVAPEIVSFRLGIDLGGTKIAAIVLGPEGDVVWQTRVATPRHDYAATLDALVRIVAAGDAAVGGPCSVGVGMPGAISPATGLVKNANSTWLNQRPFHPDLQARLGRPVRCANDANCLAMSEAADGAAVGAAVVFGVIVGTGVGGGIVVNRRVITGANAIAGEWGHNPLPWPEAVELPGPVCYCGRHGCLETWLSGPGLAGDYHRRTGAALRAEEVVEHAAAGEAAATGTLDDWMRRLARGLASVINLLDPDVIVMGGGLSEIDGVYERVPELWRQWIFSDRVDTRLVPAKYGAASGVRGAAWLWD
jgi:fructokinase